MANAVCSLRVRYNTDIATTSYLDRFLDPMTEAFTPELARRMLALRADAQLEEEIGQLRQKASEGSLGPEEEAACKDFVEAVDVLSIIQSKARQFLANRPL